MAFTKEEAVERARQDLAARIAVKESDIKEAAIEDADFPDMALGAAGKGEMSGQMITPGWRISLQANGDTLAAARVEWLAKGLKQADLMLAVERAYERAVDSGDKTVFRAAYQALKDFRTQNADAESSSFIGLGGAERVWEKDGR